MHRCEFQSSMYLCMCVHLCVYAEGEMFGTAPEEEVLSERQVREGIIFSEFATNIVSK